MSNNQYIVKFTSGSEEESVYSYAELLKTNFEIPILIVRTHCDKNDKTNKVLFHQYITNNFGKVEFDDAELKITLTYLTKVNKIIFDKNSSSAYTEFKNEMSSLVNLKFETEFYESGNVMYVGEVLYTDGKRHPHGNGNMYYDLPDYRIKYSGEFEDGVFDGAGLFYDKTGIISLKVNNISNGIPTQNGKLFINFKNNNETFDIDFFDIWDEIDIFDNKSKIELVMSDEFLDKLAEHFCDFDDDYDKLMFNEKSLDEKISQVWSLINTINDNNDKYYNKISSDMQISQLILLLFNFVVCYILLIIVNSK